MIENELKRICMKFKLNGEFEDSEVMENGHINTTYKITINCNGIRKDYILQKINIYVFKNPIEVIENIGLTTSYIKNALPKEKRERFVLNYIDSVDGKNYYIDSYNCFWRCAEYIKDSITYNLTNSSKVLEEAGKAFGNFQLLLSDFPIEKLHIVIPHFHNTINRYNNLKDAVINNYANRKDSISDVINDYLKYEDIATKMYKMQINNELPLRVTHNDTKINNVLFDKDTNDHLSVIDLDTIMPGLVGFDFGDAMRFAANTSSEDEKDLSKVKVDLSKFEAFTKGFVSEVKDTLTDNEKDTLALGAIAMTLECGARFLTDYLDGDKYFKIDYPEHNLDRCKCQLQLAKDMIGNLDSMNNIVKRYC